MRPKHSSLVDSADQAAEKVSCVPDFCTRRRRATSAPVWHQKGQPKQAKKLANARGECYVSCPILLGAASSAGVHLLRIFRGTPSPGPFSRLNRIQAFSKLPSDDRFCGGFPLGCGGRWYVMPRSPTLVCTTMGEAALAKVPRLEATYVNPTALTLGEYAF